MDLKLQAVAPEDVGSFLSDIERSFGEGMTDDQIERFRSIVELDRTVEVIDGKRRVATGGAWTSELTLPGPEPVPVAGVTFIGVRPTHRRRGILSRMMGHLHDQALERGEAAATLLASEAMIYGRFGYGIATEYRKVVIDRNAASFRTPPPPGSVEQLEPGDEAAEVLEELDGARLRTTPGSMTRTPGWARRMMLDTPDVRSGSGPLEITLSRDADGRADGIALWRLKPEWKTNRPAGTVQAIVVSAATDEARLRLHHFLLGIDLSTTVEISNADPEDPTRHVLTDPRSYATTAVADWLWVRPLDVARCLSSRRYEAPGRLTMAVVDGGDTTTFALDIGDDGSATCETTTRAPDLTLGVASLGSLLLGGHRPSALANAAVIDVHRTDGLGIADRVFPTRRAPFCDTHF